ncbi:L-idonate 5-dehydrogenase [Martelella soudanensis]|uniref:L-idonate 5-dehydrogenase n=1 Tax=unclassified Martelella TaxID=2629616 RepID=UPI0015DEADC2|nr:MULTISPECIES: L-idonate 5-dehydrogenase [unclassified Martelella]
MLKDYAIVVHAAKDLRSETRDLVPLGAGEVRLEMAWGGICGSDLHFYRHGGTGVAKLRQPMVLGHELSGRVCETTQDSRGFAVGDAVVVHPARVCGQCHGCLSGREQLCEDVRFLGSAARMPHCDGGFRRFLTIEATQLRRVPEGLPLDIAALTEPLAVALHAIARAGDVAGRTVLVMGAGPIGALLVAALRLKGAARIAAADISDFPLNLARRVGADETWNMTCTAPEDTFDVVFEATGVPDGLSAAISRARRGGVIAQVGIFAAGLVPAPLSLVVGREIDLRGCWRFGSEFNDALGMLADHSPQFSNLVTQRFSVDDYKDAFETASDRTRAMKVLLDLAVTNKGAGSPC